MRALRRLGERRGGAEVFLDIARYDNDRLPRGGLVVKTEGRRDAFGTRRESFAESAARNRDVGEDDKKESGKVVNRFVKKPNPLEEAFREAQVRLQLARQDEADIIKLLQAKRAALEEKRKKAREDAPQPSPAKPVVDAAGDPVPPAAKAEKLAEPDADAEAERLLREAENDLSEIQALEKALEKARQERYAAEKRELEASRALNGTASWPVNFANKYRF